jgi:hypothetical protein
MEKLLRIGLEKKVSTSTNLGRTLIIIMKTHNSGSTIVLSMTIGRIIVKKKIGDIQNHPGAKGLNKYRPIWSGNFHVLSQFKQLHRGSKIKTPASRSHLPWNSCQASV